MAVEKNLAVSLRRNLVLNPPTITKHGDEIVEDSLRQAGDALIGEAGNWLSKLEEAKQLKSGWRGLLPANRAKAAQIEAAVLANIQHPGVRVAAQTFDEERTVLDRNAWQRKLNSLGLGDLENL